MNSSIIIPIILIPLAILLIACFLFIIIFNKRNSSFMALLKEAKEKTDSQHEDAMGSSLKRVSVIADSNESVSSTFQELDIIHRDYVINLSKTRNLIKRFEGEIKKMRFSSKKAKNIYKDIEKDFFIITRIEDKFNNLARKVVSQDEILRKEFLFYQQKLRDVVFLYKEKRILLEIISKKIDNFNQSIKYIDKKFEEVIDKGDNMNASILIQRYIQKIVKFSKIVSSGPAIAMQIKIQIPNVVKRLSNLYLIKKKETKLPVNLSYIDFQKSIKDISRQFNRAKKYFENLEIEKCSSKIKHVLKGFKIIENQINLEVRSRNMFITTYETIIREVKSALTKWVAINKQFKEIVGKGVKLKPDLIEKYNNLKLQVRGLDKEAVDYRKDVMDKKMPYSVKMKRGFFLSENIKHTIFKINDFIDNIWEMNLNDSMIKNKFARAENALHEVIANAKKENIILSYEDKNKIKKIIDKKNELAKLLKFNISDDSKTRINDFSKNITDIYSIISSKIQMSYHIKNIINEFSALRASNPKLHLGLNLVESKFVEGNYIASLNEAIDCIKETNAL